MTTLYIHIPFCAQKCFYCSFVISVGQAHRVDQYLDSLEIEARQYQGKEIQSIYIGGGTPSHMNAHQLQKLFSMIRNSFQCQQDIEWTIELNPEDVDIEKCAMIKNEGINRVSLGVQSLNDRHLKYLGRNHNADSARKAFKNLRKAGFDNINVDLMFSFPQQTDKELKQDLRNITQLESDHLSLYALTIEKPSRFYTQNVQLKSDEVQARQYRIVCDELAKKGFLQYEVSNFSKQEKQSKHNLNYWQGGQYIGLGIGAHSYIDGLRSWNINGLNEYIACLKAGQSVREGEESLSSQMRMKEALLFGLRMNNGVRVDQIKKDYGCFLDDNETDKINRYIKEGLLTEEQGRLKASPRGRLVLDEICAQLI